MAGYVIHAWAGHATMMGFVYFAGELGLSELNLIHVVYGFMFEIS